jgi:hypothetical protein
VDAIDCTTDVCDPRTGACRHIVTPALCGTGEICDPITGCVFGRACATDADCVEADACKTAERCDPAARVCTYVTLDGDSDGDPPRVCGGLDCDDSRSDIYSGARELCDGVDNDCDGMIDERADETCGSGEICSSSACRRCGGNGEPCCGMTCNGADLICALGVCECADGLQFCDGVGCTDVQTDAMNCGACGVRAGVTCTSGLGACLRTGVGACVGGVVSCAAIPGTPTAESCNSVDDDCDGSIDEGNPDAGAPCGSNIGECAEGVLQCSGGALMCFGEIRPSIESCNNRDDDCDGSIDEENPGGGSACGSTDIGECMRGVTRCVDGVLECVGSVSAVAEVCNSLDDDCDGLLDDEVPPGPVCSVGVGACVRTGTQVCSFGSYSSCSALPGLPNVETCDAIDNDCDMVSDDGVCDVVEISAGGDHVCARRSSGSVVCWGRNDRGQLGDGTTVNSAIPVFVVGLTDAVEIGSS